MKHLIGAFFAIIIALTAQAQIKWLRTEHNFGAFNEDDGKVSTEFRFVNESDEALRIESVRSSCGCTVPEYSKTTVNHGDTASISVVYNPAGRPGRFSKSLMVKLSNDSSQRLIINGVVIGAENTLRTRFPQIIGPLRLRGNIVAFGAVKIGEMKSQFVNIYNSSTYPIKPTWSNIPKYLRVTAAHDTIQPGEQGVYSFSLTPTSNNQYGILTDSVTLNVPGEAPLAIEIAAIIEENFSRMTEQQLADAPIIQTDTDMLDFGNFAASSTPMTRQFRVTNAGKNPLLLRRLQISEPGISVEASFSKLKKGKSGTVTVTFDPSKFDATLLNARLQIITNDPAKPMTTMRLVGIPQNK